MAKRRHLSDLEKRKEGKWLAAVLRREGMSKKDLAESIGIGNPTNISLWCSGKSAIPDIDLLWIGKRFNEDVFSLRSRLLDYAEYFEGDSVLSGLSVDERKTVTNLVKMIRDGSKR